MYENMKFPVTEKVEERKHALRIAMAVGNDTLTDQRVLRHCQTLMAAGYSVVLYGVEDGKQGQPSSASKVQRQAFPTFCLPLKHSRGWRRYAEMNWKLWRRLRKEEADVLWANDVDTIVGVWMARRKGQRLVADVHEIMPEVPEVVGRRGVQCVWRTVERWLLPRCDKRLTVCQSLADYYAKRYGVQMEVVLNVPTRREAKGRGAAQQADEQPCAPMVLYQGCVNEGRGVDWAIDALEHLAEVRLVIAGGGDLLSQMKAHAAAQPWAERITFLGRLLPEELERLTPKADVGLVMLEDRGLSYHYAIPNRIGDFIQAGVPIVVSALPEMQRVVREYGVGEVIETPCLAAAGGEAAALAQAINRVLKKGKAAYEEALHRAQQELCWEKEQEKLIKIVKEL